MKVRFLVVILLAFLAITCKQEPIFFIIAKETAPTKPRIEGAPTNMVVFNWKGARIMIVASGRLHWYAQTEVPVENPENPDNPLQKKVSRWDLDKYSIPQPRGKIISLAVTPTRLYALCFDDHGSNTTLRYIEGGSEEWTSVGSASDYPILQSIYADPDKEQLFAGASKSDHKTYAISYLDNTDQDNYDKLKMLDVTKESTALLSGAVYRDGFFYLSTRGEVFRVKDDFSEPQILGEKTVVMGMIKLENEDAENGPTIIAVTRDGGTLYEVKADSIEMMMYTGTNNSDKPIVTGNYPTGALALWEDPSRNMKKLIAGVQGRLSTISSSSSYYHGYVEFEIDYDDNSFDTRQDYRRNNSLQSVDDVDRYTASLGKHPINHLFQTPQDIDEERIFFASTQTAGLWSYRYRDNEGWKGWQWNAEE
jgi:hypothetical protein